MCVCVRERECKGGGARRTSASVTYSVSFTHAVRPVLALIKLRCECFSTKREIRNFDCPLVVKDTFLTHK